MVVSNILYSTRSSTPFYADAFYGKMFGIWGNTKFRNEITNLSFYKALSCFLVDNEIAEEERRELLYSYLKPQFSTDKDTDSLNTLFPSLPSDNGYVKRVLRNICGLFRIPATITIDNDEEIINDLLEQSNFSFTMKKIHESVKLTNEVAVRPYFVDGRLKLQFATPDKYRYSTDEYNRVTDFWLHYQFVNEQNRDWTNEDRFHVWTADTYRKVNSEGRDIEPAQPNPYGSIPYLIISLDESGIDRREMWGGALWELVKAQIYANKLDFLSDQNLTYNGFAMWVLLNFGLTEQNLKLGAGRVLIKDGVYASDDYPIPPSAETVSPDAQYQEIEDIKLRKIKQALKNMEMPASAIEDNPGMAQSGTAIRLERTGLEEIRIADASVMRMYVKDLIQLIIKVANLDPASPYFRQLGEPDGYEIEVDFNEMELPDEPKASYELNTTMFKAGLITPLNYVKKFVKVDTIRTDDEAVEYIKTNKEMLKLLEMSDDTTEDNGGLDERVAADGTAGAERAGTESDNNEPDPEDN